jgi:Na+/melibiose symporter-like transporter
VQDDGVVLWMRILFSTLPFLLAVGGILLLKIYPITEEKAVEIAQDLERKLAEAV